MIAMEEVGDKRYIRGELICSLGVDGERIEAFEFPSPRFFDADDFDE